MIKFKRVSFEEFKKYFEGVDEKILSEAHENIRLPERSTKNSAGYDFFAHSNLIAKNGVIPTGIKAYMPEDAVLLLMPRSSLGFKFGFRLSNTVGVIDSDYVDNPSNEGHILIGFEADKPLTLKVGDKICQGIFTKFLTTDDDNANKERKGGVGSTGA